MKPQADYRKMLLRLRDDEVCLSLKDMNWVDEVFVQETDLTGEQMERIERIWSKCFS